MEHTFVCNYVAYMDTVDWHLHYTLIFVYVLVCVKAKVDDGAKVGDNCSFPFTYKGVEYSSCTTVEAENAWCYTVSNAGPNSPWGTCTPCGKQHSTILALAP